VYPGGSPQSNMSDLKIYAHECQALYNFWESCFRDVCRGEHWINANHYSKAKDLWIQRLIAMGLNPGSEQGFLNDYVIFENYDSFVEFVLKWG
jgi:hypothetical protein